MRKSHGINFFLLITVCIVSVLFVSVKADAGGVWIGLDDPQPAPQSGGIFETALKFTTWDTAMGAYLITVHYDPSLLQILQVTMPAQSEFYGNTFVNTNSFASGTTDIAAFQVVNLSAQGSPATFATIRWKAIGAAGTSATIGLEAKTMIDSFWRPIDVINENLTITFIDTTPPDTTITISPNNPSNTKSASFSFSSTESNSTFECQLDNGSYTVCTSPREYSGLAEGSHTFSVRATDAAGNTDTTPATYTWIIDTASPTSALTQPANGMSLYTNIFAIKGSANDGAGTEVQKVEVSTDGGISWNLAAGTTSWSYNWTIPRLGTYTIKSRATDNVGNIETPGDGVTVSFVQRQPSEVTINTSNRQLLVNGNPFTIKGVGYSPVPIGDDPETTPPYGDYFTSDYSSIYDRDLPLLRDMGANTIHLWVWDNTADHLAFLDKAYNDGVNPIYVIAGFWINPSLDIDPTSPSNVRGQLKAQFREMVAIHKNHPAILMWAIGSDLNASSMYGNHLDHLFSLINELATESHVEEGSNYHPVTTALADINLINTILNHDASVPALDVWGANVYRGNTFGTLFADFYAASTKPLAILEYGIDSYDNTHGDEYEKIGTPYQADYAETLWKEIEANADTCIGGSIMAYSDEWWKGKYGTGTGCPDNNPAVHSTCGYTAASHPDGYSNEEYSGIVRIIDNGTGPDIMEPRYVYYRLQSLWLPQYTLNATKTGTGSGTVNSSDGKISCGSDCSESYSPDTVVTLTATPDAGSTFAGWGGNVDCSDGQVTMDADKTCIATFTLLLPNISASTASLNFGNVDVGLTSSPQTVTISNDGTGNLNISSASITGAEFIKQVDTCYTYSGNSLAPSETCQIQLVFSPASTGSKTAKLTITSNDPDEGAVIVTLTGNGAASIKRYGNELEKFIKHLRHGNKLLEKFIKHLLKEIGKIVR